MDGISRDDFIQKNMGLVQMVVNKFLSRIEGNSFVDREDLVSLGTIGLIEAYDNFNPSFGTRFSTYAVPMIMGRIKRFFRDHLDTIKFSRQFKTDYYKISKAGLLNEKPGVIAALLDMSVDDVENALAYYRYKYTDSLDQAIYQDDGEPITLAEKVGTEIDMDSSLEIEMFLKQFDDRTRKIIELRLNDLTQTQIAPIVGVSQVQISRILKKVQNQIKGGIEVSANEKKSNFDLALKLAKETNLTTTEIMEMTGVSYPTAYRYVKSHRASEEEIEDAKNRMTPTEAPVKTYKLTPEELEKYRLDKQNYKPLDQPSIKPVEKIESANHKPIITKEEPVIVDEKPAAIVEEKKIEYPKVNVDGHLTLSINLSTDNVTNQIEDIVKAMKLLGFKELNIKIQSQQVA